MGGDCYRPIYPPEFQRRDPLYSQTRALKEPTYHFQARTTLPVPQNYLTCRAWANSPDGCRSNRCQYAHHRTGQMSPALPYTCIFWSRGQCYLRSDECMYAHTMNPPSPKKLGSSEHCRPTPSDKKREVAITKAAARAGFNVSDKARVKDLISAVTDVADKFKEDEAYLPSQSVHGEGYKRLYSDRWAPGRARSAERIRTRRRSRERSPEIPRSLKYWRDHEAQSISSAQRIFELPPDSRPLPGSMRSEKKELQRNPGIYGNSQPKLIFDLPRNEFLRSQEDLHPRSISPSVSNFHSNQKKMISDLPERALLDAQEIHQRPRSQLGSSFHGDSQSKMSSDLPARVLLRAEEDLRQRRKNSSMTVQDLWKAEPNNIPVGERFRKRSATSSDNESDSQPLKIRRLDVMDTEATAVHDGLLIKLNETIERGLYNHKQPVLTSLTTNANIRTVSTAMAWEPTNPVANAAAGKKRPNEHKRRRQSGSDTSTKKAFKKLKRWLAQSADRVLQVRRDLGARWEADPTLKELVATDRLAELNAYLGQIGDGIAGAIGVANEFA